MRTIDSYQMKKIYAIANALGIKGSGHDDELHTLVAGVTGKDSIKSLTYQEAGAVIKRLTELQGAAVSPPSMKRRAKKHESRPGGVTPGQQDKIWALMYELKKYDAVPNDVSLGYRVCKILKKEMNVDAIARTPFVWLTFAQGNTLIEILKRYVASAQRKGGAGNGIEG